MYYTNNLSYWNRKRNSTAFGMSTEEKKLARYDIIKFTKAHSFPISNDNKRMVVRGVGEVKLTGSESVPDITRDDFVEGTYFIRDSKLRTLLAINLETEEEAKDIILHPPKKDTQRNRPKEFIPIMLKNVTRTGLAWRRTQVKPEDVLKEFNVRGGEFGNWLSDKDRQASLNFCYDSFMDLAYALGIRSEDVSFDGKLAIAFGARGRSRAMAHFEPKANVINLTKMKGAGTLGHEWVHAMDHNLSLFLNMPAHYHMASEHTYNKYFNIPQEYVDLINTINNSPNYINTAKKLDRVCNFKTPYYNSTAELLARAGAAYIKDKLEEKGISNDYLCAHADICVPPDLWWSPQGEEREAINQAFDKWIAKACEIGFFQETVLEPLKTVNVEQNQIIPKREDIPFPETVSQFKEVSLFDMLDIPDPDKQIDEDIDP